MLDIKKLVNKLASVLYRARFVKQKINRGFYAQLVDVITLYRTNPTCNIFDYYKYKVYSVARGSALYKELLGTGSLEAFSRSLNPRNAVTPAWDKMLFAMLCNAYKLPTPEILAIYKPKGPFPDLVDNKFTSVAQVKAFLREEKGPIFVKPVKGNKGLGAFFIADVDEECEFIFDKSGASISFHEFIDKTIGFTGSHRYKPDAGVLFQRPVVQHQAITEFTQTDTPSGLRVLVLNTGSGPYIHRAIWKIIAPGNISDNLHEGRHGNMVAQVDPATGKVSAAVDGYWPTTRFYTKHPVSGQDFNNFSLPLWQQVTAEVLRASSAINGMGAMHWDIIIAENGAVLLELNDIGGTEFFQLHGHGLIDENLKSELRQAAVLQPDSAFARLIVR